MANLKLKRLKIEKFRNVAPTELRFNDGLNVLLGQNGTGKTTLLRLAAMASASNFSSLRNTEFAVEYDLAHPAFELTVSLRNQPSESGIESGTSVRLMQRIRRQSESMVWSYHIEFKVKDTSNSYRTSASSSPINRGHDSGSQEHKQYNWEPNPFNSAFVFLAISAAVHREKNQLRPQDLRAMFNLLSDGIVRLDEGLGGFAAMTGAAADSEYEEIGNAQVIIHMTGEEVGGYDSNFLPSLLLRRISEVSRTNPSIVSIKDDEMEFLQKATNAMQFTRGELLVELQSKDVNDSMIKLTYGRLGFRFTLKDGSIISQQALSYGQKRLLTFLYYSAANSDVIVADELVNGLHHEWIQSCLDEIGDRQSLLTSQNPLLLDFLSFNSPEDVERTFILCRTNKRSEKNIMDWFNLGSEDADRFYRAYEAGIQHVSEILRTKGLW